MKSWPSSILIIVLPLVLFIGLVYWLLANRLESDMAHEVTGTAAATRESFLSRVDEMTTEAEAMARALGPPPAGRSNWMGIDFDSFDWDSGGAVLMELLDVRGEISLIDFSGQVPDSFLLDPRDTVWLAPSSADYETSLKFYSGGPEPVVKVAAPISSAERTWGRLVLSYRIWDVFAPIESGVESYHVDILDSSGDHIYPLRPLDEVRSLQSGLAGGLGELSLDPTGGVLYHIREVDGGGWSSGWAPVSMDGRVIAYLCLSRGRGGLVAQVGLIRWGLIGLAGLVLVLVFVFTFFTSHFHRAQDLERLISGLEDREQERTEQGIRVSQVTEKLARKLSLGEGEVQTLRQAALLRQIGLIALSREILHKPEPLSEEERNLIELHPSVAEKMLDQLKFSPDVIDIVKHHHEKYDGSGYPGKLARDEIPLMARILSVSEAYVAMRSELPYRPSISRAETINELKTNSGGQFDPSVVSSMLELIEEGLV